MSNRRKLRQQKKGVARAVKNRELGRTPLHPAGKRYNGYQCDPNGGCGGIWLTVDLDPGTTPMFSPCMVTPDCDGMAVSLGYPRALPPAKLPILIEWYSPANSEMSRIEREAPDLADHVRRGGLLRRPAFDCPEWVSERLGPVFIREGEQFMQPTLTYILGDRDADSQEQGDHVHHAGSEGAGGEGAELGPAGQGDAAEAAEPPAGEPGEDPAVR